MLGECGVLLDDPFEHQLRVPVKKRGNPEEHFVAEI